MDVQTMRASAYESTQMYPQQMHALNINAMYGAYTAQIRNSVPGVMRNMWYSMGIPESLSSVEILTYLHDKVELYELYVNEPKYPYNSVNVISKMGMFELGIVYEAITDNSTDREIIKQIKHLLTGEFGEIYEHQIAAEYYQKIKLINHYQRKLNKIKRKSKIKKESIERYNKLIELLKKEAEEIEEKHAEVLL